MGDMILADGSGAEIRVLTDDYDIEIGKGSKNDIKITVPYMQWRGDIRDGCRVYIPGGEYGGRIGDIRPSTRAGEVAAYGYTWRGLLDRIIIEPARGEDYRTASGDLTEIIAEVLSLKNGTLFRAGAELTGVSVSWRFARYVSVLEGLTAMLAASGYKLVLKYLQTQDGGYVEVSAAKSATRPDEYSSDGDVSYSAKLNHRGVNHMICLGSGELKDREVIHLYVQADGTIGGTQHYVRDDLIEEIYDNNGLSGNNLREAGVKQLREVMNKDTFSARLDNKTQDDLLIGDVVTGMDDITGQRIARPIVQKIIKKTGGVASVEFRLEGEDS